MLIFVISFILLPAGLSYMKGPAGRQLRYLNLKIFTASLLKIEHWAFNHKKIVYASTLVLIIFSFVGMSRLKTEGFIVDDLPKTDKIYQDLKFFENNFHGVMPLEIIH
jgi:predicted RND superfamily exporter protein